MAPPLIAIASQPHSQGDIPALQSDTFRGEGDGFGAKGDTFGAKATPSALNPVTVSTPTPFPCFQRGFRLGARPSRQHWLERTLATAFGPAGTDGPFLARLPQSRGGGGKTGGDNRPAGTT